MLTFPSYQMRIISIYHIKMSFCKVAMVSFLSFFMMAGIATAASNFGQDFDITFGDHRAQILEGGQLLTLSQDKGSGAGFKSKNEYLFGRFDMQMKLAPGNSAGTVTTFYLSSEGSNHDEIDIEFLGNSTGEPYTLHTNVFSEGKGNREQQFHLWFDPSQDFHNYTIIWNTHRIVLLVDGSPIRVFNNFESSLGVPYPKKQPMWIYCSFWNADDWATQGGRVKADWSQGSKTVSYSNYSINACLGSQQGSCASSSTGASHDSSWPNVVLDEAGRDRLRWVQQKFMVYNYCADQWKFPQGLPRECLHSEYQNEHSTTQNPANSTQHKSSNSTNHNPANSTNSNQPNSTNSTASNSGDLLKSANSTILKSANSTASV